MTIRKFLGLLACGCISLLSFCRAFAAGNAQMVNAPISSVRVYLSAAFIDHSQSITLKPGINNLVFTGLASSLNDRYVRLENLGAAELQKITVLRIDENTDLSEIDAQVMAAVKMKKDSLFGVDRTIIRLKYEIEALELQQKMFQENTVPITGEKTITASELKSGSELFRDAYKEICLEIAAKKRARGEWLKIKRRLITTAFLSSNTGDEPAHITVILARVNNPGEELSTGARLSYLSEEAAWLPAYEVFASNNNSIKLNYKARLLNNTGKDWEGVNLTLSTADPMQYYTVPGLDPLYVSRYNRYESKAKDDDRKANPAFVDMLVPDREIILPVSKPYILQSSPTPYLLDVASYELKPDFLYRTAPRKEETVSLIARIGDWEKLNLVDGEAMVYNNGLFVGKSMLKPSETEDILELPLGAANTIHVNYKLVSEYSSKKLLGTEVMAAFTYEIRLKSSSPSRVLLEILDQVPVSEESSVKTDIQELSGGEKEPLTGIITWKEELNPASEKVLTLKYSVTYPRKKGYGISKAKYLQRNARFM